MIIKENIIKIVKQSEKTYKELKIVYFFIITIMFSCLLIIMQFLSLNSYLKSNNPNATIYDYYGLFTSDILIYVSGGLLSLIITYFIYVISYSERYYVDEIKIEINNKKCELIKTIRILDISEIDDNTYRIKINMYNLIHKNKIKELDVEKWKVTRKMKRFRPFKYEN